MAEDDSGDGRSPRSNPIYPWVSDLVRDLNLGRQQGPQAFATAAWDALESSRLLDRLRAGCQVVNQRAGRLLVAESQRARPHVVPSRYHLPDSKIAYSMQLEIGRSEMRLVFHASGGGLFTGAKRVEDQRRLPLPLDRLDQVPVEACFQFLVNGFASGDWPGLTSTFGGSNRG